MLRNLRSIVLIPLSRAGPTTSPLRACSRAGLAWLAFAGCGGDGGTTDPGPITVSLVASRALGVAPLSVFFDATGTTDPAVTSRPFHDLEYRWNFGDPAGSPVSGTTWSTGSGAGLNSRNAAMGPVAAHVFETPGTYRVTLTVFDGTHTANAETTVTVDDPDVVFAGTSTVCVSTSTDFAGCPGGALQVPNAASFAAAVSTYALTGRRVLFRRGDTYTESTSARIDQDGPGIVGAFGDLAATKPLIRSDIIAIQLSSQETPNIGDWRVMDLEFAGLPGNSVAVNADGGFSQVTLLRLKGHDFTDTFDFNFLVLDWHNNHGYPGHTIWDQAAIVDCEVTHVINGGMGSFIAAERFAFLGNMYDDAASGAGQHIVRIPYANKAILGNNTLGRAAAGRHVLKLHAPMQGETGTVNPDGTSYTEKVIVSDNTFIAGDSAWTASIEPQNSVRDERLRDIIFERNWLYGGSSQQQTAFLVSASEATVRNNLCDMTGAVWHQCIAVVHRGVEPAPTNVRVYNNTIYSGAGDDFQGIFIDATATNVTVINNLGSAPFATAPEMISGTGASGFVESSNLLHNSPAVLFTSATPTVPADFSPNPTSPARDTGLSTVPVYSDFFGTTRPQNGVTDIGAVEGP